MADMNMPCRTEIANHIVTRLREKRGHLCEQFGRPGRVPSCWLDGLLPVELGHSIYSSFPLPDRMMLKSSLKERKHVAAQMNEHAPILEDVVFAFQDKRVLQLVAEITGLREMEADTNLYAGGISAMFKGDYLKPHLDNSHDKNRERYRVLNLLYYVTPNWHESYGGNLELWDNGPKGTPRLVPSLFNRLVLMATNKSSWHSVSEVLHEGSRCCVSNYYFSQVSPDACSYFHATSFRGRPEDGIGDLVMAADNVLRTAVLKTLGSRVYKNPHIYKRPNGD